MQYYLRRLHELNGTLRTFREEPGSVTSDPHKLYPKQVREMWRQWGKSPRGYVGSTKGLIYGVWELPAGQWTTTSAAEYAELAGALAEVYVILGPEGRWHPTRLATHPDNRIVFEKWKE